MREKGRDAVVGIVAHSTSVSSSSSRNIDERVDHHLWMGREGDVVRATVTVVDGGVVNGLRVRVLVAVARVRLIVVVSVSHLEVALRGSHALSVLAQRQLETHRLQQTQVLSLLRCMHSSSVENI